MATADEVIVQFEARIGRYERDVRKAARTFEQATKAQRADMRRLEQEIRRSSGSISTQMKGLAGTLAAAFSVRQIQQTLDAYTRFTNQLGVAGYEGEQLADVQERLFAIAQKYGVELESVGTLFGRNAASAKELNLTLQDQLTIVEATSAALKITGASAAESSGALLQLTQLLGGNKVQAQEFNSLIDGARPLLQAVAAGSDKWGGSVAKLTADVKESNVTVREFTDALLKGADTVIGKADKATLTIGNSFTVLNNAIGKYLGEGDDALTLTERLSEAIIALADNLDTVANAVTVVAAVLLGRFVAGTVAGGTALRVLAAYASVATTSLAGTALAARSAGAALLGALGGPVGIAVAALALGIGYLATESAAASAEADRLSQVAEQNAKAFGTAESAARAHGKELDNLSAEEVEALAATAGLKIEVDKLADAHYRAEAAARAHAIQEQKLALLASARRYREAYREAQGQVSGLGAPGNTGGYAGLGGVSRPVDRETVFNNLLGSDAYKDFKRDLATLKAMQDSPIVVERPSGSGDDDDDDPKPKKASAPSGITADELEDQFISQLRRAQAEELQARIDAAKSAEDRADLQDELNQLEASERRRLLELEFEQAANEVLESEKLTAQEKKDAVAFLAEQKKARTAIIDALYGVVTSIGENGEIIVTPNQGLYPAEVMEELTAELERQAQDMIDRQIDTLDAMAAVERDIDARHQLELQMIDLQEQIEKSLLEQAIANGEIADADRARALLAKRQAAQREATRVDQLSPGDRFAYELDRTDSELRALEEDAYVGGLKQLNSELANAIVNFESLREAALSTIRSIAANLIEIGLEQYLTKPLLGALGFDGGEAGQAAQSAQQQAAAVQLQAAGTTLGGASASLTGAATTLTGSSATMTAASGTLTSAAVLWQATASQIMVAAAALAASGGGGGGGVPGLGGLGGARAGGGPVRAGVPYKVGEFGEEVFLPQNAGTIIPNRNLQLPMQQLRPAGSGGGRSYTDARSFNFDNSFYGFTDGRGARKAAGEQRRQMRRDFSGPGKRTE